MSERDERTRAACDYCGRESDCSTTPGTGGGGMECDPPCPELLESVRAEAKVMRGRCYEAEAKVHQLTREKALVTTRVSHQRRELRVLDRVYRQTARLLGVRCRALSLLAPLVRELEGVSETELGHIRELDEDWLGRLAGAELDRRRAWHFVGVQYPELAAPPELAPRLEETG